MYKRQAIDGEEGILYVDPDPETLERLKEKKARQEEAARLLLEIGVPALKIISLSFILAGFGIACSSLFQACLLYTSRCV